MTRLKHIVDIKNGKAAPKEKGVYPIFGGNGILGYTNKYNYENLVIIGRVGANCGSIHKFQDKCWVSDNALAALPKNDANDFNYYLLKSANLNKRHIGSSQPLLTQSILNEIFIKFPEESPDQQKIGDYLSNLDSKIDLNNKVNFELEALAKLIYDYWFVQFDFPDENGKPYKSSGGKMVWSEELNRKIPNGWCVKRISDCLNTSLGGTPSTKNNEYWENGEINWLNSEEVSDFPVLSSKKKISNAGLKNSAATLLPIGSIVISIVRYIRTSMLGIEATANQSVVGIFESDLLKKSYIYPFFINETPRLMSLRTGAQQPHVNKNVIDTTQMLIPDQKILRNYYELVDSMYEYIIISASETKKLSELRDWLLPMLMNGQVKIKVDKK